MKKNPRSKVDLPSCAGATLERLKKETRTDIVVPNVKSKSSEISKSEAARKQ